MIVADEIYTNVRKLPEPLQTEVLDFVTFLLLKVEREGALEDDSVWSRLSLDMAMSDMTSEITPEYTVDDIKEKSE